MKEILPIPLSTMIDIVYCFYSPKGYCILYLIILKHIYVIQPQVRYPSRLKYEKVFPN